MKTITFLYLTLFTCIACAPLGTRTKTYNQLNKDLIQEVAVVITEIDWMDKSFGKTVDSLFIKNIISSIESKLGIRAKYIGNSENLLQQGDKIIEDNPNVNAIIHCELNLRGMLTLDNSNRYNSAVKTQMFKVPEKVLIAQTKFNTTMGKSYARHPLLEVAIKDGVEGAIIPYLEILN